jgi:hypothetical protein
MALVDADRYTALTKQTQYGRSDGLFYDSTTSGLAMVVDGTIVNRWDSSGNPSIVVENEARGDLLHRGASAWERLAAATSAQILVGDGTDLASVAVSGDATLSAAGALAVADLTIASEARGDLLRRGASAWERVAAKTSGQILVGDGTDIASVAVSGDVALSSAGAATVTDFTIASEARGDLLRRGASAWERVDAKTSGQIMVGDGTDIASVAVSGDVALSSAGAATVTDLTIASEARGDILRRGASAWERLDSKTSGQILVGDGTDVASVAVSGDATLAANGAVSLASSMIKVATVTVSAAEIRALDVSPITLVAAGGAGVYRIFLEAFLQLDYGSTAHDDAAADGDLIIEYADGTDVSTTLEADTFIDGAADQFRTMKQLTTDITPPANSAIRILNDGDPFTGTGDGVLVVNVRYWEITAS